MTDEVKLLRLPAVLERTGLSRRSVFRLMARGRFPKSISLAGTRAKAWRSDEMDAWVEQQTAAARGVEN